MNYKHAEFIKSIRVSGGESEQKKKAMQERRDPEAHKMSGLGESDLQKELERRFDELFGTTEED